MIKKVKINLGGRVIEKESRDCFFIAEIGLNFYEIANLYKISYLDALEKMIKEAAKFGADAIKMQIYITENLVHPSKKEDYEFFKEREVFLPEATEMWKEIKNICNENNVVFIATVLDETSLSYVNKYIDVFKIASFDIVNESLIKKIAMLNKPVIISTGASHNYEIDSAVHWVKECGNNNIAILHCVSSYPTRVEDLNLRQIRNLNMNYEDHVIGYSDHSSDFQNVILSSAHLLGANIIEKHFSLDRTIKTGDHFHSITPTMLTTIREALAVDRIILGEYDEKYPIGAELDTYNIGRRKSMLLRDMKSGEVITENDIINIKASDKGILLSPYVLGYAKLKADHKAESFIKADDIVVRG